MTLISVRYLFEFLSLEWLGGCWSCVCACVWSFIALHLEFGLLGFVSSGSDDIDIEGMDAEDS